MFSLAQKTALVLGGSSGIGRALALGLADAGADVIVSARRQELVDSTASEIEAKGRQTIRAVADVRDRQSLVNLRDTILGSFAKLDIFATGHMLAVDGGFLASGVNQ